MAGTVRALVLGVCRIWGWPVFFIVGRHVHVWLLGSERFWCLYCETNRSYQRRAWSSTFFVVFLPVANTRGEFVFCQACGSAFDPECLDESTTATCDELIMQVPFPALSARVRAQPRTSPIGYIDSDPDEPRSATAAVGTPMVELPGERRSLRGRLSARSTSRRH